MLQVGKIVSKDAMKGHRVSWVCDRLQKINKEVKKERNRKEKFKLLCFSQISNFDFVQKVCVCVCVCVLSWSKCGLLLSPLLFAFC
jgi:hypothetical protein